MPAETRQFKMHPKLLFDVIQRQAGTLAKAILEGVMNSVDAEATECRITTSQTTVTIVDDGRGFRNRKEIEDWFEVFGQPHDESEKKVYGTFRMGRGQLFAYGRNVWATGGFRMRIDFKEEGIDYKLLEVPAKERVQGCEITVDLYNPLLPMQADETERLIEQWVKWCPIPVYYNNRLISRNPDTAEWDEVLPEAYVSLKSSGGLAIYNLGVHVLEFPRHRFGTGGEVVSRQQLTVNFARNDIQSDCKVWPKIVKFVDQRATQANREKHTLDDAGRQRLADQLLRGQIALDFAGMNLKLLTAVTGRHFAIDTLLKQHEYPLVTSAKLGSHKGDRIHRQRIAFVIADVTLQRFKTPSVPEFLAKLISLAKKDSQSRHYAESLGNVKWEDMSELGKNISDTHDMLDATALKPREMLWLELVGQAMHVLTGEDEQAKYRKLHIGASDCALGWTDGKSYIALARKLFDGYDFNMRGFLAVGRVVLHEMCHHTPNLEDHDHDQAFYEEFHDNALSLGLFVEKCYTLLPTIAKRLKQRLTKRALYDRNRVVGAEIVMAEFPHVAIRKP